MYCFTGLGNPGAEYQKTRHNLGFMVVDYFGLRHQANFQTGEGPYQFSRLDHCSEPILLVKPMTYMNRSGMAVADVMHRFHIDKEKLLVIVDDVELPTGRLRIRRGGSDGGHNGLASVIEVLGTDFPRLRMGIGRSETGDQIGHVLSQFEKAEEKIVTAMILKAADVLKDFVVHDIEYVMNHYNGEQIASKSES